MKWLVAHANQIIKRMNKKKLTVVIIKMIVKINDDLRAINPLTPELNLGSTK